MKIQIIFCDERLLFFAQNGVGSHLHFTVVGLSDFFYFSKYFTGHTGKIIKILKANLNAAVFIA